jgi:hypothetical protein
MLHLWLFAPRLTVSFSAPTPISTEDPVLVAKIMYKTLLPREFDVLVTESERMGMQPLSVFIDV